MNHAVLALLVFSATALATGGIVGFGWRRAKRGQPTPGFLLTLGLAIASVLIVGFARRALEPKDVVGMLVIAGAFVVGFTLPVAWFGRRFLRELQARLPPAPPGQPTEPNPGRPARD